MKEEIEKIRDRIQRQNLVISRIPVNTKNRFLELASEEEFCKDYGMVIKYLIDFHDGIVVDGNEKIISEIETIKSELNQIKEQLTKTEEKPKRKMLGGNRI